jgi:hypothetical protein
MDIMWPEFRPQTLLDALDFFAKKERRFGLTPEQVKGQLPVGAPLLSSQAFDPLDRIES